MNQDKTDWLTSIIKKEGISSADIPNIDMYMDQVTTFMDTQLAANKRYEDDKIMTKTMINNYTKNHLLPPSIKKKYSKEHIFLLIMIYYLKNMLSISDIQTLLAPLSEHYFPSNKEAGLSLNDIYDHFLEGHSDLEDSMEQEILSMWEDSRGSFNDYALSTEQAEYLDDFSFIFRLCYDIYIRKQIIEKIIDRRREQYISDKAKKKKEEKKKNKRTE